MNPRQFLTLLVAALVVIGAGLFLSSKRNQTHADAPGGALFPALAGELDTVTSLQVRKASASPGVTLHRHGEQWSVAQRGDYPADVVKLRRLLLSLADAKINEAKTSNPANFAILGLEDPAAPNASGTQIDFAAKDGAHSVIIGKPAGEGNFVRRGGENQTYTVEPSIFVESEPRFWIDSKLIDIPVADITKIEYQPAGAAAYGVHRLPAAPAPAQPTKDATDPAKNPPPAPPAPTGFALDSVPAGRKPADAQSLAPSSSTFAGLTADDVAPLADVDFSKPSKAALTLNDGSVVTILGVTVGDKHWIQFNGIKDAAFAARAAGRAFEIAGYRYDGLFRPLEQLLLPKESPPAKPASAKAPAGLGPAGTPAGAGTVPAPKASSKVPKPPAP